MTLPAWCVTIGTVVLILGIAVLVVRAGWRAMYDVTPERPRRKWPTRSPRK